MKIFLPGPVSLRVVTEKWPLTVPFKITGHVFESVEVLLVTLDNGAVVGQGEAGGVYFRNDNPAGMARQIEALRARIEGGITRDDVQRLLPPGGARNALDCALWDLEAKLGEVPVWQIADLERPRPLLTTFGCGADTPEAMATLARAYTHARAIKLKLTGESIDADRVRAVREARPDVWLGIDANQGFTRPFFEQLLPVLTQAAVLLIEQPFPVGQESLLDGFQSPIPIAADESAHSLEDLAALIGRFNFVNIKLDKSGGLTEGLAMARAARNLGLDTMVGNMIGTSLAMAPAFLLGQLCSVVDLDGPLFLKFDRPLPVEYKDGYIYCPDTIWGNSTATTEGLSWRSIKSTS
jgi:L-alanine-DL-glutamate epimerase-like enolase superfamily enzyme